ncbi:hypothetical protein NFJ02_22g48250 [Pycnococcus provasolii]
MSNVPGTKCCIVELVLAWHDAAGPAAAAAAKKYGAKSDKGWSRSGMAHEPQQGQGGGAHLQAHGELGCS